ncbi:hypothetical protein ACFXI6_28060, partial [Streptomyces mirabilis]
MTRPIRPARGPEGEPRARLPHHGLTRSFRHARGRYFVDCNETEVIDRRSGTLHGVARYAVDPDNARRLWTLSEQLGSRSGL